MQRVKTKIRRNILRRGLKEQRLDTRIGNAEYYPGSGHQRSCGRGRVAKACIPCRFVMKDTYICPHCHSQMLSLPAKFPVPRKQDKWWSSLEAFDMWAWHLGKLEAETNRYLASLEVTL